jgi:hypothetical protein
MAYPDHFYVRQGPIPIKCRRTTLWRDTLAWRQYRFLQAFLHNNTHFSADFDTSGYENHQMRPIIRKRAILTSVAPARWTSDKMASESTCASSWESPQDVNVVVHWLLRWLVSSRCSEIIHRSSRLKWSIALSVAGPILTIASIGAGRRVFLATGFWNKTVWGLREGHCEQVYELQHDWEWWLCLHLLPARPVEHGHCVLWG